MLRDLVPFPLSHSALDTFKTCPRQYQGKYVSNEVKYSESEAAKMGNWLHAEIEKYVKHNMLGVEHSNPVYRMHLAAAIEFVDTLRRNMQNRPHELLAEVSFGVDENLTPLPYTDKRNLFRGRIDLLCLSAPFAYMFDYKSGKKHASLQQKRNAVCVFAHHPEVKRIKTIFVYTKTKELVCEDIERDDLDSIVKDLLSDITDVADAYKKNDWPTKPCGLCHGYCGVTACRHNSQ